MLVNLATPVMAWEILSAKKDSALLIDVRTDAECKYVGVPDLSSINKDLIIVPLLTFPSMEYNPQFLRDITNIVSGVNSEPELFVFFMCKGGGRSQKAAEIFVNSGIAGIDNSKFVTFNIDKGFEGDLDENFHRGNINGWKASKLPWRQG